MELLSYQRFLLESYEFKKATEVKEAFLNAICNHMLEGEERELCRSLIAEGQASNLFDIAYNLNESEISELYESIESGSEINEDSLVAKFKEKAAAALKVAKEKGKEALSKTQEVVLKVGGDLLKAIKAVTGKIGEAVKKMWEAGKSVAQQAVDAVKEKIEEKLQKHLASKEDKKRVLDELQGLKDMAKGAGSWITGSYTEGVEKSADAAAVEESAGFMRNFEYGMIEVITEEINSGRKIQDIIEELSDTQMLESGSSGLNIPFVSSAIHKMEKFPPFSLIHKVEKAAAKVAEGALNRISIILNKLGAAGGPYKFPILGAIVGVAVGYYTEHKLHDGIHDIAHGIQHALHFAIPGLGLIMELITYGGIAAAVHTLVVSLAGSKGKEEHEEEKEETKEKPKEDKKEENAE